MGLVFRRILTPLNWSIRFAGPVHRGGRPCLALFIQHAGRDLNAIGGRRAEPNGGGVRQGVRDERGLQNPCHCDLERTRMADRIVKREIRQHPRSSPCFGWNNRRAGCFVCFINDSRQCGACISRFRRSKRGTLSGVTCLSRCDRNLLCQLCS